MNDQMIRVISSPSSSTRGFFTVILAMCGVRRSGEWSGEGWEEEGLVCGN
jgi:hypothetical protein